MNCQLLYNIITWTWKPDNIIKSNQKKRNIKTEKGYGNTETHFCHIDPKCNCMYFFVTFLQVAFCKCIINRMNFGNIFSCFVSAFSAQERKKIAVDISCLNSYSQTSQNTHYSTLIQNKHFNNYQTMWQCKHTCSFQKGGWWPLVMSSKETPLFYTSRQFPSCDIALSWV